MPSTHKRDILLTFHRYREIIDDWESFRSVSRTPLPATLWTNTLKTTTAQLAQRLPLSPLKWNSLGFRCPVEIKPSHHLPFLAGHYLVQEEAAMLPVLLLDPQPGELILDMCAAPGNKTIQMAILMESKGLIVANDRSAGRLGILRRSLSRLGLTNIGITCADAVGYPGEPGIFDRVLLDVPCSGEGTLRRWQKPFFPTSDKRRRHLKNIQTAILERGIKLCRPGGRIVYSTCTFAPEENEAIINASLQKHEGKITIEKVFTPGLKTMPGLTSWNSESFHPDLDRAVRIWPHHNNTGGFFSAVLRKAGYSDSEPTDFHPEAEKQTLAEEFWGYAAQRFGIKSSRFANHDILAFNKKHSFLAFPYSWPASIPAPIQRGMPLARIYREKPKLKTGAAMAMGESATLNILILNRDQVESYVKRESFGLTPDQLGKNTTRGYVLLRYQGMDIGLGFLRVSDKDKYVESQLPRHWLHADVVVHPSAPVEPA